MLKVKMHVGCEVFEDIKYYLVTIQEENLQTKSEHTNTELNKIFS